MRLLRGRLTDFNKWVVKKGLKYLGWSKDLREFPKKRVFSGFASGEIVCEFPKNVV